MFMKCMSLKKKGVAKRNIEDNIFYTGWENNEIMLIKVLRLFSPSK
jgi:hypothetical protein